MRNSPVIFGLGFLSIVISPQPYICLGTLCGLIIFLRFLEWDSHLRMQLSFAFLMIFTVLSSSYLNNTAIGYEEQKRLIGVAAVGFNLIFFRKYLFSWTSNEDRRINAFLFLCFGLLFSSLIWYNFKINVSESNYSWIKYYGAFPLAITVSQLSVTPLFKRMNISISKIGVLTGLCLYSSEAKSAAFLVVFGTLAMSRFGGGTRSARRQSISEAKLKSRKLSFVSYSVAALLVSSLVWYLGYRGFLGSKSQSGISNYGPNIFAALSNARPELQISLSAIRQMPWYGYGTPENALGFGFGYLANLSDVSAINLHQINMRVLGSGLNVHSWFFEMVLRGGLIVGFLFIPLVISISRILMHPELFKKFPGLYLACLFTLFDLFFSPFTWFSPIQLALSLLALEITKLEVGNRKLDLP